MNRIPLARRRGFGLVELLVAMVVLVLASVSLLGLAGGETRGVALSEDHLVARQFLDELRQGVPSVLGEIAPTLGPPPPRDTILTAGPFGFLEGSLGIAATRLMEDPALTGRDPGFGEEASPAEEQMLAWAAQRQLVRAVYLEEDQAAGTKLVVLRVQYTSATGARRTAEAFFPSEL